MSKDVAHARNTKSECKNLLKRYHFSQHQMSKTNFEVHIKHLNYTSIILTQGLCPNEMNLINFLGSHFLLNTDVCNIQI